MTKHIPTPSQPTPKSQRIHLVSSYSQYDPRLKAGAKGWTLPRGRVNPDHACARYHLPYIMVQFDIDCVMAVDPKSIAPIQESKPVSRNKHTKATWTYQRNHNWMHQPTHQPMAQLA